MWNPKIVPCFMVPLLLISNITLVKSNELKKLKKKVVKLEKKVDDTQVEINTMKVGVSSTRRISLTLFLLAMGGISPYMNVT